MSDLNHFDERGLDPIDDSIIADPKAPIRLERAAERLAVILRSSSQPRFHGPPDSILDIAVERRDILAQNSYVVDDPEHVYFQTSLWLTQRWPLVAFSRRSAMTARPRSSMSSTPSRMRSRAVIESVVPLDFESDRTFA